MSFRSACTLILIAALFPGAWAQSTASKKKHPTTTTKTSARHKPATIKRAPIQKFRPTKKHHPTATTKKVHGRSRVTTASTHASHTTEIAPVNVETAALHSETDTLHATALSTTASRIAANRETTIARLTADLASPRVGIEFASNLRPFFDQLRSLELAPQSGTVRIFQFGDSHTAADMFTGALRTLFQNRFGDAGPGFSLAGYPFAGYRIHGTKHAQSTGWIALGTHLRDIGDALVGMGGVSLSTDKPGNWVSLDTEAVSLDVHYLVQPGGGQFEIYDGDQFLATVSTDGPQAGPEAAGTKSLTVAPGPHHFEVRTTEYGPVRLLGMVAEKSFGVTYDAMGLNGAEASLLLRWNQDLLATYLQEREPNLIVLAYGTNEAADHTWTEESYAAMFRSLIERFHTMSPGVPILVVGPADRDLRAGRRKWAPFIGTDRIIAAQRSVCRQMHCAYWNQQARMGGFGSMHEWVAVDWAQSDHTHFTGEGYTELASALFSDIVTQYNTYEGISPAAGSNAP